MLEGCVPWPQDVAERYRAAGYWRGETLGNLLRGWAAAYGDRVALVAGDGGRVTYRELDAWADRLAAGFAEHGIAPRDRVVVQLPNAPEFVAVCFALFRLGALPVFALPSYRVHEIRHLITLSGAVAYVIPDEFKGFDHRALAREIRAELPQIAHVFVAGDAGDADEADEAFTSLRDLERERPRWPSPTPRTSRSSCCPAARRPCPSSSRAPTTTTPTRPASPRRSANSARTPSTWRCSRSSSTSPGAARASSACSAPAAAWSSPRAPAPRCASR
ncbi:hypothetical protein GCM10020000_75360 [Streptomyces olivoverticillatus]